MADHPRCTNKSKIKKRGLIILIPIVCGAVLLIFLLSALYAFRHKSKKRGTNQLQPSPKIVLTLKRFEARELEKATNSFSTDNIIGSSSLSTVYKGRFDNGQLIAVKKLNLEQFAAESDKSFYKEANILMQLRHKNLVKILGYAWESRKMKALVLEFMENGSLEEMIHGSDHENGWSLGERVEILSSVADGLVYLHSGYDVEIVHCDLKPSNVLLDRDSRARVSDFGTSRMLGLHLEQGKSVSSAFQGTIGYLAPELAYMRKVTTKVDVFSFGIIIMEVMTKKRPTGLTAGDGSPITLSELVHRALQPGTEGGLEGIVDPNLTSSTDKVSHEALGGLLHLALACTSQDPENRPNMDQVLASLSKIRSMA